MENGAPKIDFYVSIGFKAESRKGGSE